MTSDRSIVLTGFMGTGKSTVGRAIAERLGWPFVDTDAVIEQRHGPIPSIFENHGEAAFRTMELDLAAELSQQRERVVATGGGFMVQPEAVHSLGRAASVWCLTASPDEILRRVADDPTQRPLLAGRDPLRSIQHLLATRETAYARFPGISTDGRETAEIADEILTLVGAEPRRLAVAAGPDSTTCDIGVGLLSRLELPAATAVLTDSRTAEIHAPLLGRHVRLHVIQRRADPMAQIPDPASSEWTDVSTVVALGGRSVQAAGALVDSYLAVATPLIAAPSTLSAIAELATAAGVGPVDSIVVDVATLQSLPMDRMSDALAALSERGHLAKVDQWVDLDDAALTARLTGPGALAGLLELVECVVCSIADRSG